MRIHTFRLKMLIGGGLILLVVLAGALYVIDARGKPTAAAALQLSPHTIVLLDPGHGGLDGGAVSAKGVPEADINLAISKKTQALMGFLGISAQLTRNDEQSLDFDPDDTVRENKNADLHARLDMALENPEWDFISIHLNKFGEVKYYGAQIFYSPNCEGSKLLAETLQEYMRLTLDPENTRRAKMAPDTVFLMKSIKTPAVTVECGFLSNVREAELLQQDGYQSKIAMSLAAGYIDYKAAQ